MKTLKAHGRSQRDSTANMALALHAAHLGLYGPLSITERGDPIAEPGLFPV